MANEVNTPDELSSSPETTPSAEDEEVKAEETEQSEEIDTEEKPQFYREEDVPEELKPKWKEMNKAFTESRQEIADWQGKAVKYDEIMDEVERGGEEVEEELGAKGEAEAREEAEARAEDFSLLSPEEQKARIGEIVQQQYEAADYPRRLEAAERELAAIEKDPQYTGLLEKHAPRIQEIFEKHPGVSEIPNGLKFVLKSLAFSDAIQQGKNVAYAEMKKKKTMQVETPGSSSASVSDNEEIKTYEDAWRVAGEQLKRKK